MRRRLALGTLGRRQAFSEGVVLWTRDSSLVLKIRRSVRLGTDERASGVRETLLRLGWMGLCPRAWMGRTIHGYRWALPPDLWSGVAPWNLPTRA